MSALLFYFLKISKQKAAQNNGLNTFSIFLHVEELKRPLRQHSLLQLRTIFFFFNGLYHVFVGSDFSSRSMCKLSTLQTDYLSCYIRFDVRGRVRGATLGPCYISILRQRTLAKITWCYAYATYNYVCKGHWV